MGWRNDEREEPWQPLSQEDKPSQQVTPPGLQCLRFEYVKQRSFATVYEAASVLRVLDDVMSAVRRLDGEKQRSRRLQHSATDAFHDASHISARAHASAKLTLSSFPPLMDLLESCPNKNETHRQVLQAQNV